MIVNLAVTVTGKYCNHWPYLKILHNDVILYDNQVIGTQVLTFDLECNNKNLLSFEHYRKSSGENGVWDTTDTEDCVLTVDDVEFDQVSIGVHLKSKLLFKTNWTTHQLKSEPVEFIDQHSEIYSNGVMSFNGAINLEFDAPVYDWLILNKYKVPIADTAYFSNYSLRWHYQEDNKIISEIKELLAHDQNSNT